MRVLFLENQDSFSWNVIDALPVKREDVAIFSGHPSSTATQQPRLTDYDCLIIGPGPTDPVRTGLIEIVHEATRLELPTLGICLGHQAIGLAFGAQLVRTDPCHGKRSIVTFQGSRSFPAIGGSRTVMRYHSLSLAGVKSPLKSVASTSDGIPMAIEHESLPIAGFQFHPDSYATEDGREMFASFFASML